MSIENRDDFIKLGNNFYFIQAPGRGLFPFCNCFLLTGKETILVDAGLSEKQIKSIDEEVRIDRLVVTHSHPDHILRWHLLSDRILMFPQETPDCINDLQLLGERFTGTVAGGTDWKHMIGDGLGFQPVRKPDVLFCDGDIIDAGEGLQLQAIHAPGHIDDHYCFFEKSTETLITTDIDFTSFGPWYANPESSIDVFRESIEKVMMIPHRQVCTSHKLPIFKNAVKNFELFLEGFSRHRKLILDLCERGMSIQEMIDESPFYRDRMDDKKIQYIFEWALIRKNLDVLLKEGIAVYREGRYVLTG